MLKFFKTWTFPISMLAGAIGYFVFANVTFLEPTKPFMYTLIAYLTPFLIFAQLLLTFCKHLCPGIDAQPLARLAIAYPSDFQFGACRLIALAANERGIPGCVRGSDGLPDLPDRYGGRRDYG